MTMLSLDFALQQIDTITLAEEAQFAAWCKTALQYGLSNTHCQHHYPLWQITLRIVDSAEGQTLNREYRHKDYATNVLSFYYDPPFDEFELVDDKALDDDTEQLLNTGYGDIVMCAPVVVAEAKAQQKSLQAHTAHLTVHATLHLLGYDHQTEQDAAVMEPLETMILQHLNFNNPYEEL